MPLTVSRNGPHSGSVVVFMPEQQGGRHRLNAAVTARLAVLGALAGRMISLDRLLSTARCLADDGWTPSRDIFLRTLQGDKREGTVKLTESWIRGSPFHYSLTRAGADEFDQLVQLPLRNAEDPVVHSAAAIKFGLLELLDDNWIVLDLRRHYSARIQSLEGNRSAVAPERDLILQTINERLAWLERRVEVLDEYLSKH